MIIEVIECIITVMPIANKIMKGKEKEIIKETLKQHKLERLLGDIRIIEAVEAVIVGIVFELFIIEGLTNKLIKLSIVVFFIFFIQAGYFEYMLKKILARKGDKVLLRQHIIIAIIILLSIFTSLGFIEPHGNERCYELIIAAIYFLLALGLLWCEHKNRKKVKKELKSSKCYIKDSTDKIVREVKMTEEYINIKNKANIIRVKSKERGVDTKDDFDLDTHTIEIVMENETIKVNKANYRQHI